MGYKSLAQMPTHRDRPVSSNVRPHILKAVPIVRENKTVEARCFCKNAGCQKKTALHKHVKPHAIN